MDTKRLEQIGETFIVSNLLDAGILVAKPFFDRLGADLIGFTSIDNKGRFCRIQCKYRELKKTTSVQIDSKYVVGAFILFIYIKVASKRHFYCLLPDDIQRIFSHRAIKTKSVFRLSITRRVAESLEKDKSIRFTQEKITAIYKLMKSSSPDSEFRRMISDLSKNFKKLTETRRKYTELNQLVHELEAKTVEKKAIEEKIEILEEYQGFMEKHCKGQNHNK